MQEGQLSLPVINLKLINYNLKKLQTRKPDSVISAEADSYHLSGSAITNGIFLPTHPTFLPKQNRASRP